MMDAGELAIALIAVAGPLLVGFVWMGFALGSLLGKLGEPAVHAWVPVWRWGAAARAARMSTVPVVIVRTVAALGLVAVIVGLGIAVGAAPDTDPIVRPLLVWGGLAAALGTLAGWVMWIYGSGTIEMRLRAPAALSWLAALAPVVWASVMGWGRYGRSRARPHTREATGTRESAGTRVEGAAAGDGVTRDGAARDSDALSPRPTPGTAGTDGPADSEPPAQPTPVLASPPESDGPSEPEVAGDQDRSDLVALPPGWDAAAGDGHEPETAAPPVSTPLPVRQASPPSEPSVPHEDSVPDEAAEPGPAALDEPSPEAPRTPGTPGSDAAVGSQEPPTVVPTEPEPYTGPISPYMAAPASPARPASDEPSAPPVAYTEPDPTGALPIVGGWDAVDSFPDDEREEPATAADSPEPTPEPEPDVARGTGAEPEHGLEPEPEPEPQPEPQPEPAAHAQSPEAPAPQPDARTQAMHEPAAASEPPSRPTPPWAPVTAPSVPLRENHVAALAPLPPMDDTDGDEDDHAVTASRSEEEPAASSVDEPDDHTIVARRRRETWVLDVIGGRRYTLAGDAVRIGRSSSAPGPARLAIEDATRTMSKLHAELRRDGDRWLVRDLGSTNGTYLRSDGSERRIGEHEEAPVDGVLVLGDLEARIVRDGEER